MTTVPQPDPVPTSNLHERAFWHTRSRLYTRHGLPITVSEYQQLCTQVECGTKNVNPRQASNPQRQIVSLVHLGQRLDWVYDREIKVIVTVLPRARRKPRKARTLIGDCRRKVRDPRRRTPLQED